MTFYIFIAFLICQRLSELYVSSRNEKWLLQHGAVEYGRDHYPYMVTMHTLFIISLIVEYNLRHEVFANYYFIALFVLLCCLKAIVIANLGTYWNTRIYRVPGTPPVATGIYKYIKHPNYIIVVIEIAVIPLAFGLYYTCFIFSLLNAAMLTVRIRKENEALAS
ncbi:hypothetical protein INP83_19085 [Mucilaginibacter sp. 21P]|uniref:isoprenylcysteine carboxyl methyltransferase family protein n=1 Tax=Mucilaginibacter sp. 21P TaxID=2778902 RepID=UPI001C593D3D|nr:isoprenylcysteine carboxylmethyltransferase family protein [Mucilaginibacter sp. 21P]QXV65158.1 hypothetical protein INP83_19085 [Mucilaginibacter sp. 21P]